MDASSCQYLQLYALFTSHCVSAEYEPFYRFSLGSRSFCFINFGHGKEAIKEGISEEISELHLQ
jgi:hypothetical protein